MKISGPELLGEATASGNFAPLTNNIYDLGHSNLKWKDIHVSGTVDGINLQEFSASVATANPTITSIDYPGTATATDPAGGESVIINGTLFASGITCTVGGTSSTTVFNSATQITITTPAKAAGDYTVAVTNLNGGTISQASFIQYSGVPIWSTAAGTLGNVQEGEAASFQVTATEGSDTIEYAVTTGTLPTGLSLATATGAITGTAPAVSADTTTTFSITATDDENQTSAVRSFSITVQNDGPSNHFSAVVWDGDGSSDRLISGLNFQSDFVWAKQRTPNATDHIIVDSVRGGTGTGPSATNLNLLYPEGNYAQATNVGNSFIPSIENNGFKVGTHSYVNSISSKYVAWCFKAGGAATDVTSSSSAVSSALLSANTTSGFSIMKYVQNGNSVVVPHGLATTPSMVILKKTGSSSSWFVFNNFISNKGRGFLENSTAFDNSGVPTFTSTEIQLQNQDPFSPTSTVVMYSFASTTGFSKVSSYDGTSASGNIISTEVVAGDGGFEPAFVMVRKVNGGSWLMYDNKRNTSNPRNTTLVADTNRIDYTTDLLGIDFLSNGFVITGTDSDYNANGETYLYLAFAADGSTATPSLANSFATEIYAGNAGTQSITGTGFKPDFSWIKARNFAYNHALVDSVRGRNSTLISDLTNAANPNSGVDKDLISFDTNGITVGPVQQAYINPNYNMASWNWKAGGTPAINTDGTITSLVSANQAAGFSIVKWTGNGNASSTVGHGLAAPEMIIYKDTSNARNWGVYVSSAPAANVPYGGGLDLAGPFNTSAGSNGAPGVPTSTTITFTNGSVSVNNVNASNASIIAYCFKSISGYSKVGTYTWSGTSYTAGTMVTGLGFTPGLVIIKRTNGTANWQMYDSSRGATSGTQQRYALYSDSTSTEDTSGYQGIGFDSDGFSAIVGADGNTTGGGGLNENGGTYIYLAIKEN